MTTVVSARTTALCLHKGQQQSNKHKYHSNDKQSFLKSNLPSKNYDLFLGVTLPSSMLFANKHIVLTSFRIAAQRDLFFL